MGRVESVEADSARSEIRLNYASGPGASDRNAGDLVVVDALDYSLCEKRLLDREDLSERGVVPGALVWFVGWETGAEVVEAGWVYHVGPVQALVTLRPFDLEMHRALVCELSMREAPSFQVDEARLFGLLELTRIWLPLADSREADGRWKAEATLDVSEILARVAALGLYEAEDWETDFWSLDLSASEILEMKVKLRGVLEAAPCEAFELRIKDESWWTSTATRPVRVVED